MYTICVKTNASGLKCSVNSLFFFSPFSYSSLPLPPLLPSFLPFLFPSLSTPAFLQVLLINFPSLGSFSAGENFRFIFREAKINDAILFFDECEAIFESREKGSHDVNMLLTEIER